jgi:hypothetical protein
LKLVGGSGELQVQPIQAPVQIGRGNQAPGDAGHQAIVSSQQVFETLADIPELRHRLPARP